MAKKEVEYTDEQLGELRIIDDFLPSPEQLVFQEEKVKVTLTLSKASLDFFKREAEKHHTQYQKMIRKLIDVYVNQHR
jgi:predicted DNA binding CopG/RHH family protein